MRSPAPAPPSPLQLRINCPPLIHPSLTHSLAYQLVMALYSCLVIYAEMPPGNARITGYCVLFVGHELVKVVAMLLEGVDPLGVGAAREVLGRLGWGLKGCLLYLLGVLAWRHSSLPVLIMAAHFLVANYPRSRPDSMQGRGRSYCKIMDFVNPILVYSFLKQFDARQPNLSIFFLAFLCGNLACCSELRLILANHGCDLVGRTLRYRPNGKTEQVWDKGHALKILMIGCSVALVFQNFLLVFQELKKQLCLNILHTLLNGLTVYVLNHGLTRGHTLAKS